MPSLPVPGAARKRRGNSLSRGQRPKLLLQDVCRRDDLTTEKGGAAAGASASTPPSRVVPAAIFRVPLTPVAPGVILPLPATSPPIRPSPLPCNLSWCSLSLCAPYDASLNHRAVAAKVIAARGPSDSVFIKVQGYVSSVERWLAVQRHERPLEARRSSAISSGKASMRVGSFPAGSSVLYVADGLPDCSPGWMYEASLIVSAGETRRTNNLPPVSGGRARRRGPGGCPGRLRRAA